FLIITKVRNNFFLTGVDLLGRILYKCSPGMIGYTGTDRMSKYAWCDTAYDFFVGLAEACRYYYRTHRPQYKRWKHSKYRRKAIKKVRRFKYGFNLKLDLYKVDGDVSFIKYVNPNNKSKNLKF